MMKAGIYARVSTQKEAQQDSIAHQEEKGKMVAQELGATIENVYIDDGKSGTKVAGRKEYQRMIEDIVNRRIDIIVTKDVERLNRNLLEFCKFLDLVIQNDIKIFFYLTNEYYNITSDTLIKIKAVLAEDYSKSLSLKAREAHLTRQENGAAVIFTNKTWGYKVKYDEDSGKKKVVIDKAEAHMIKIIFDLCIQGLGVHKIAKRLYVMGYTNHNGKMFSNSVISSILRNPKVMGTVIYNQRTYDYGKKKYIHNPENTWIVKENVVPAIISPQTFSLANAMLQSRKSKVGNDFEEEKVVGYFAGSSKLNGKLICGICGDKYSKQARKLGDGKRVYDWKCSRHIKYGRRTENQYQKSKSKKIDTRLSDGCDSPTIKQEVVYKIIKKITEEHFGTDNKLIEKSLGFLKSSIDNLRENDSSKMETDKIKEAINGVNSKINKLTDKLLEGILTNENYKNAVSKYEKEREELKVKLFHIEKKYGELQDTENRINEIQNLLEEGGMEEASINTVLEFIDKIFIFSNRLEVTFQMDQLLGINNHELCERLAKEKKLVYYLDKDEMKYKRQDIDRTSEIIFNAIRDNSKISIQELVEISGLSTTTVHYRVKRFKELGYIRHRLETGRKKEWEVLKAWNPDDSQKIVIRSK